MSDIHKQVQDYYGKELQNSNDLKTNACCAIEAPSDHVMQALRNVHDEVQAKYYGCGLVIPTEMQGLKVLDLGSGSGRDCYIAAQLVGESGKIVGVDMTDEQLAVANEYLDYHREKFNYKTSNVEFLKGNIEKLDELNLEKNSFDLIISNCVINLAADKEKVLRDAYDLLKKGGEMYFSDVYADRRVPTELQKDPVLWGECLSGALYWNDFLTFSKKSGFTDPRIVESRELTVENPELQKKLGDIVFYSVTYRLFKLPQLEAACEEYGQTVTYKGTLSESPDEMVLDKDHVFTKNEKVKVCGNTYLMLNQSRYKDHFEFTGDFSNHQGLFDTCGSARPYAEQTKVSCC
jgi:arsenite methyltransferase